jgi:1,2-diacylglycerol 3-alpha-glucosyltransferase
MITRIGIITNTYPPIRNGVSMAVLGLEKALQAKGIQVFIATPEVDGVKYTDNICVLPCADLPKSMSADLKLPRGYIKACRKFFEENQVQIIHTHDTLFGGIEGAFVASELNIPCVHTFHTMIEQYNVVKFPAYRMIIKQAIREVCNSYNNIICPSQKVYDYLLDLGITSPITQIYNVPYLASQEFVDTDRFKDLAPNGDFSFVSFCRLSPEKGVDHGIQTLAPILQKHPNINYVIAGDGPEKANLQQLADNLGIGKQVVFVGKYLPQELPSLLKSINAKVFLFTSYSENLPTNILEAMYFGLPVVAVDDSSVDYLVQDGVNGYKQPLEKLTELCEKLYLEKDLRETMSKNATQTATTFIGQDIAQKHIQLYQNIIEIHNSNKSDKEEFGYKQFRLGSIFSIVSKLIKKIKKVSKNNF